MKLPNAYGSVYRLSGKRRNPWVARKTIGWKQVPEKRRSYPIYQFIGYYPTRAAALQALADYNADPYDPRARAVTFKDVYERWSGEHFPAMKYTNNYEMAFNICTPLHDVRMADIKLGHLQKVVDESGKNTPTLRALKSMLRQMWGYAIKHEYIPSDRAEMIQYVDIRKAGNPNTVERKPFSKSEIAELWKRAGSPEAVALYPYPSVVLILIYTGVRVGELLTLKKEDVHLGDRWFYVRSSKTASGVREVPIAEKIVPLMEYWLSRDCAYLVCTTSGQPFSYQNFYAMYWSPLMERLNMPHRPHDTRHTCISLLTEAGVDDRLVKQIVGHKGTSVTEAVYTHISLATKLEAVNKICY